MTCGERGFILTSRVGFILPLILLLLGSCSNYRIRKVGNPLENFGITSVSIPQFINRSNHPGLSRIFSKEFVQTLQEFPDLKVHTGEGAVTDGVLIGIITAPKYLNESLATTNRKFSRAEETGDRRRFFIPASTDVRVRLELILIRDPNHYDKELILSRYREFVNRHPKVVFTHKFDMTRGMSRVNFGKTGADGLGTVNFTNNLGTQKQTYELLAQDAVQNFKELILYAF